MLVKGVAGDINALGYFGLAYYEANTDTLNAVGDRQRRRQLCDAEPGDGPGWHVRAALSPALVYVKADSLKRPEVQEFIRFYLNQAAELAPEVGYVASPDETYTEDMESFEAAISGERHARQRGG